MDGVVETFWGAMGLTSYDEGRRRMGRLPAVYLRGELACLAGLIPAQNSTLALSRSKQEIFMGI